LAGYQRIGEIRVQRDGDDRHQRRSEEEERRGNQVRGGLAVRLRKGALVEGRDALAEVTALAVDGGVSPGDEAVEIRGDWLRWPVALCTREVGRFPAIEGGQREH